MSRYGPWAVLGINPTSDQAEVRRVYAGLLKNTHPEDDPEGFQRLRAAYEGALRDAHWIRVDEAEEAAEAAEAEAGPQPAATPDETDTDLPETRVRTAPALKAVRPERQSSAPSLMTSPEPAAPPHPELSALAAAEEDHMALIQALADAVYDPEADPGRRMAALEAVLASPAMQGMAVAERTEAFVSHLIDSAAPKGDELIDRAIAYFGWDSSRIGGWREVAQPVLQRREDLDRLHRLRHSHTEEAEAYRLLRRKPTWWGRLRTRLTPGLDRKVRNFLWVTRHQNPGVMDDLDPAALAWWEAYFSRPRIGGVALMCLALAIGLALPAVLTALGGLQAETRLFLALASMPMTVAAALIGKHYVVDVPRHALAERLNWSFPLWLRAGWAPAVAVPLLLAALIPASLPATIALGALAALPLLWALIAAEPDREDEGEHGWESWSYLSLITIAFWMTQWLWRPGMRYDWKLRVGLTFAYLGIFFYVAGTVIPEARWGQMAAPLLGAALAVAVGLGTLIDLWRHETTAKLRLGAHAGAMLLVVVSLGLTFLEPFSLWGPLAVAVASLPILAHKAAAKDLDGGASTWRDLAMRYGWVAWLAAAGFAAGGTPAPEISLRFMILWATSGAVITTIACLTREYAPKKARQKRPVWDR